MCLDSRLRYGESGINCKMDLERAYYDHVNWDFLLYMLRRCGFGEKLCSWIAHCIFSMRFLILANDTPIGFFISFYGLRQGDPLSPLLFVMVIKALGMMISIAMSGSLFPGFSMGIGNIGGIDISHFQFVDDNLILCGANPDHLCCLRCLFLCFEVVSGLKINVPKSKLVHVGNVDNVDALASILGCGVSSFEVSWSTIGGLL
jgi:hypothetical protein